MQEILKKAARWYITETGFTLDQMRADLKLILRHRQKAFANGDLQQVYKVFAATEIVKAAICILLNEEYRTNFSRSELAQIKAMSNPLPETFVCRHCGKELPASAFRPDERYTNNLSRYCIGCAREIGKYRRLQAYQRSGYVNGRGEIICTC